MTVRRFDSGALKMDTKRTVEGFLRCDATIARTGCQTYRVSGGGSRVEYRPPDEVFHVDALLSAEEAPITYTPDTWNMHPPEPVSARNALKYSVGWTGAVKADGKFVKTTVKIIDEKAIEAAEKGTATELSCGYSCDLDFTPGITSEGEKYDAIQKNIRVNHVAMVRRARAGSDVRLRLDSDDNAEFDNPEGSKPMPVKMNIEGVDVEVPELASQLITKERSNHQSALEGLKKQHADAETASGKTLSEARAELDKQKARADAAEAAKVSADKARADAEDPKKIDVIVQQRATLFSQVHSVLGPEAKLEGKDTITLKREALAKLAPDMKLDGKSNEYIEAAFDYSYTDFSKKNPAAIARFGVMDPTPQPGDRGDAADARHEFMHQEQERAKKMGQSSTKN